MWLTFFGGGGGLCWKASLTASAADSGSLFRLFLESVSESTTKKCWHFSHFTKRVDADEPEGRKEATESRQRTTLGEVTQAGLNAH